MIEWAITPPHTQRREQRSLIASGQSLMHRCPRSIAEMWLVSWPFGFRPDKLIERQPGLRLSGAGTGVVPLALDMLVGMLVCRRERAVAGMVWAHKRKLENWPGKWEEEPGCTVGELVGDTLERERVGTMVLAGDKLEPGLAGMVLARVDMGLAGAYKGQVVADIGEEQVESTEERVSGMNEELACIPVGEDKLELERPDMLGQRLGMKRVGSNRMSLGLVGEQVVRRLELLGPRIEGQRVLGKPVGEQSMRERLVHKLGQSIWELPQGILVLVVRGP